MKELYRAAVGVTSFTTNIHRSTHIPGLRSILKIYIVVGWEIFCVSQGMLPECYLARAEERPFASHCISQKVPHILQSTSKVINAYDRPFPLKFEVREPEISSRQTNRIRVSVTKHIELVFCSTKKSEVSHITQITSSSLGFKIVLAISINLTRIMIRLRDAL
jgi:hypothetical protein